MLVLYSEVGKFVNKFGNSIVKKTEYPGIADEPFHELPNIAKKILEICSTENIKVSDLSNKLGISEMTLRRIISAKNYAPNLKVLQVLAKYMNCTIAELLVEQYPVYVNSYSSLENFAANVGEVKKFLVSKEIYLTSKLKQLVHIKYYKDLHELFVLTNELPNKSFAGIFLSDEELQFGYVEYNDLINDKYLLVHNFTEMKTKQILKESVNLVARKVNVICYE